MLITLLRIMQANANRSIAATESILKLGIREKADLISIQEPWLLYDKDKGY